MGRVVCFVLLLLAGNSYSATPIHLTTAAAVESSAERPEQVDFTKARVVALPDNWRRAGRGEHDVVWYSMPLDAALQSIPRRAPLALVVPRVAEKGDFWVNGERLEVGTGFGTTRNRALWFDLRPSALRPDGNVLEIRVAGGRGVRNGLSAIRFGYASELRLGYECRTLPTSIASSGRRAPSFPCSWRSSGARSRASLSRAEALTRRCATP